MIKSLPPTPPATPITFSPAQNSQSLVGLPQIWPPYCSFHSPIVPPLQGGQAFHAQPLALSLLLKPLYTHFSLPLCAHWLPARLVQPFCPSHSIQRTPYFSARLYMAIITCTCWIGLATTGSRGQVQVIHAPRIQQRALVCAAKHVREGLCACVAPKFHCQELK